MNIEYRTIKPEDYEAVRRFLMDEGWQSRVNDAERFARMMEKTDRAIVVSEQGRVIGFGRALCDGVSNGYISMLAVAHDRRGRGIGREIVRWLTEIDVDGNLTWVLRAGRESSGFWAKMGFNHSQIAMERTRR